MAWHRVDEPSAASICWVLVNWKSILLSYLCLFSAFDGLAPLSRTTNCNADMLMLLMAWHRVDGPLAASICWVLVNYKRILLAYLCLFSAFDGLAPLSRATNCTGDTLMLLMAWHRVDGPSAASICWVLVKYKRISLAYLYLFSAFDGLTPLSRATNCTGDMLMLLMAWHRVDRPSAASMCKV